MPDAALRSTHTIHTPVMDAGFVIDAPLRVAKYGISSVLLILKIVNIFTKINDQREQVLAYCESSNWLAALPPCDFPARWHTRRINT